MASLLGGGLSGGNGDPPPTLQDHQWISAAIQLSRLPAAGTRVCYFPAGHHEQWADLLGPAPAADPAKPFAPCAIAAVEVVTAAHAPYATITLSPAPDEPQGAPDPVSDLFRYTVKKLSGSDVRMPSLIVPKPSAQIFPNFGPNNKKQQLVMRDTMGGSWNLTHTNTGPKSPHHLRGDWVKFVTAKGAKSENSVFLVYQVEEGTFFVEVRKSLDTAEAEIQRLMAPPPVLQEEINESVAAVDAGEGLFRVTYYPHKGHGPFVVPRSMVDAAMGVGWQTGMLVRARKLILENILNSQLNTPPAAVGRITAVHQPISGWGSLQVVWGQSTNPLPANSWEVELLPGDGGDAPPPPAKKQKIASLESEGPSASSHVQ